MGPSLYGVQLGAVLEVRIGDDRFAPLVRAWSINVFRLLDALGWIRGPLRVRRQPGGASLFLPAPVDVLMTATEVSEQAWVAAESGEDPPAAIVVRLRDAADIERRTHPNFLDVHAGATVNEITVNFDDDSVCLGSGVGSRVWPMVHLPPASEIPWRQLSDVPIALVTGSNGKTTTTRLVAAMWRAAGRVAGWCCSDGVWVDDVQLESGDYSGPGGARAVLRDSRVEAAVLETARGGILRRGLAVNRASAAIITNISADHFGEYGIGSLTELAEVKEVVASALGDSGRLVLNADDAQLVRLAERVGAPVSWFSIAPEHPLLDAHVAAGGNVAIVVDGHAMLHLNNTWHDLGDVIAMPITLGGAAPHNIANVLGASLLGAAMGVPVSAIRDALSTFGAAAADNPGRLQVYRFGSVTVLTDFAHNPDGLAALCATAKAIAAARRLLILGQAGNRNDDLLRALPRAAFAVMPFDHVIIKEMVSMLRGREPGEIPGILADEVSRLGVPPEDVEIVESEIEAIRRALSWARDGDLLVCPVHVSKTEVFALLQRLDDAGWSPGTALPNAAIL
jgi:cyanophycin synthetase